MSPLHRHCRSLLRRPPSPVRQLALGYQTLNVAEKIEEETLPWYSPDRFYPARIGQVFQSRYQVVGKLGYGAYSTAWLCRDLQGYQYVTLKIYERDSPKALKELQVYQHLNSISTNRSGCLLVRTSTDNFELSTSHGRHQCLIHPPLGESLASLRSKTRGRKLPEPLLKATLTHVLLALDFLHSEAGVIHTDVQEKNILLGVEDESILSRFENGESTCPSPRKVDGDRVVYQSRVLDTPKTYGRPVLCDFGEARFGSNTYYEDIQPYLYRAPEVLLRIPWDNKVDIWNVGVMAWDLSQNKHLFVAQDTNKQDSNLHHVAEMIALMGMPPNDFLQRSEYAREFFDPNGVWKGTIEIPPLSLEACERSLPAENKDRFLQFMRKMLRWMPSSRPTAGELLTDPWLTS